MERADHVVLRDSTSARSFQDVPAPAGSRQDSAHWRARLAVLMPRHNVPGAVLGILRNDQIIDVASGVLSMATRVPATPDSVFQIGSITKVWTATMIMQLIDEGMLTLDTPVIQVLPEFGLSDPQAAAAITIRHLLTHTSGIAGDVFIDTGRGDDCLKKYVAQLRSEEFRQVHGVGATYSYCNAGYVVAGRIIEALTCRPWDTALRERLIAPLGLTATVTLPEEAILHGAAVGHLTENGLEPVPTSNWVLPRCMGPAGLIAARAYDLLVFARMHMRGGQAPDGRQILSATTAQAMTERHVTFPDAQSALTRGDSRGLGWIRLNWNGRRVIGHSGGTIGQRAFLRLLPDEEFATVLLTNGGDAQGLYQELSTELFSDLTSVTLPEPFAPPAEQVIVDVARHVGRYTNSGLELDVLDRNGTALLRKKATRTLAERAERLGEQATEEYELIPVSKDQFAVRPRQARSWDSVRFYNLPDGSRFLHWLGRAYAHSHVDP
jgi:CubicO group peptidase (beta-lactamase class C family)